MVLLCMNDYVYLLLNIDFGANVIVTNMIVFTAMAETKLTKAHRKYLGGCCVRFLHQMPEDDLRRHIDSAAPTLFTRLVRDISHFCFTQLQQAYPTTSFSMDLLSKGIIENAVRQIIGQIIVAFDSLNDSMIYALPGVRERMQLVKQLHVELKAKEKIESSLKRSRTEDESTLSEHTTSATPDIAVAEAKSLDISSRPPVLHLLPDKAIFHLSMPQLGEGRWAVVKQVAVQHPDFPEPVYAAKCFKILPHGTPAVQRALEEATVVDIQHRGMILPMAISRYSPRPALISRLWNGGHVEQWIQDCKSDGSKLVIRDYLNTCGTIEKFQENILQIINAVLQTVKFIHHHHFLHNDLHGRNIMLHFGEKGVYAGICDWGSASTFPTTKTFPKLLSLSLEVKAKQEKDYPWAPPECISTEPPPFSRETDIYTVCHTLRRILNCMPEPADIEKRNFVRNIHRFFIAGKSHAPGGRPNAFDLSLCMSGAHRHGYNIVPNSGLRPLDD